MTLWCSRVYSKIGFPALFFDKRNCPEEMMNSLYMKGYNFTTYFREKQMIFRFFPPMITSYADQST